MSKHHGAVFGAGPDAPTPEAFLARYWQREPLLVRQAFPGFQPPLDGDDLAGLACEALAESRLVSGRWPAGPWELRHGPFDEGDFSDLPERDWTLLVQDCEKHYPPLAGLLDHFHFLPRWRLDDIMISFAAPGGSVGPHVDQYDVFLLQAQGHRRWQIAKQYDPAPIPDLPLDMLAHFEPEQAWDLEPGDLLYLPPGVAHHGVALDAGMTYSIGLRAPSAADLVLGLGEWLADQPGEGGRYADPGISAAHRAGEVDAPALARFQDLLRSTLADTPRFAEFIGTWISRNRLAIEPAAPPSAPAGSRLAAALHAGRGLHRHPWTRLNWLERDGAAVLFAAGEPFPCAPDLAQALCGPQPLRLERRPDAADEAVLVAMARAGHLLLEDPEPNA